MSRRDEPPVLRSELKNGSILKRTVLEQPVVLFKGENGQPGALEDRCPHRNVALSLGCVEGNNLQCGYHGLQFDTSGTCVHMPGSERLPVRSFGAHSYPLMDLSGYLWIWMGDRKRADAAGVPHV